MKKFLVSILVAILFLSCESFAHATEVQIYDYSVDNIINDLKSVVGQSGVDIWGKEYYTYKGVKRCELHFGNSNRNIIRFRLNNDNSVSRILVTFPNELSESSLQSSRQAGVVLAFVLDRLGLSESECKNLMSKLLNGITNVAKREPYRTHFHEKYSIWCSKTQRYITLDVEFDLSKVDYYLYASI